MIKPYRGQIAPWWVLASCNAGDVAACMNATAEWVAQVDAVLGPPAGGGAGDAGGGGTGGGTGGGAGGVPAKAQAGGLDVVGLVSIAAIAGGLWWFFRG